MWDYKHPLPCLNEGRYLHGSCAIGSKLYVVGGENTAGQLIDSIEFIQLLTGNKNEIYSFVSKYWSIVRIDGLGPRRNPLVSPLLENKLLIYGGNCGSNLCDGVVFDTSRRSVVANDILQEQFRVQSYSAG